MHSLAGSLEALARDELDFALATATVTSKRSMLMLFSFPYYVSGQAILVNARQMRHIWVLLEVMRSQIVVDSLFALVLLLLVYGHILWYVERGKNPLVDKHYIPGVFEAMWCTFAIKSTIGFGDVVPHKWAARVLAIDFQGKFPDHADLSPDYHRTAATGTRSIVNAMRGTYVKNTRIFICPITANGVGRVWLNYANPASFADNTTTDYGGWDTTASYVFTPYMWLANFSASPAMKFVNAQGVVSANPDENEPAWPKRNFELDSRRAFIRHRVSDTPGTALWDLGHLGRFGGGNQSKPLWSWAITADQPVGQADGSVIVRPKAQIRMRAIGGPSPDTRYYY